MQNNKTFRLFISSTFNDFRGERKALQEDVFPKIKDYCSKHGLTFQPIDLRWGVPNEAQLDQKTLELCLNEVRSCKLHPTPNFLLMLGDRYGWVPLPYHIEQNEFELLRKIITSENKKVKLNYKKYKLKLEDSNSVEEQKEDRVVSHVELLEQWYQLDQNQIPVSYVLQERHPNKEYKYYENWEPEESALRIILQSAVEQSFLDESEKTKYFQSATEAEIIEGVFPYLGKTHFQETLIKEQPGLVEIDKNNVFGFFRSIDKGSKVGNGFIPEDKEYQKAQAFKARVKAVLEKKLELRTHQSTKEALSAGYLEEFKTDVEAFLKERINEQLTANKAVSELDQEIQAHRYYAQQKIQNFIGQKTILKQINDYCDRDSQRPLVIYGPSGIGKSAIMAKAVESQSNAIIRFVGATPNSSAIKPILYSIFEQLGIDARSFQEKQQIMTGVGVKPFDLASSETESFEGFSFRMHDQIMQLKKLDKSVVIFIDAVDQLSHADQFLWLPKTLPNNVKIILSALNDHKYPEDSNYFRTLKNKTDQILELKAFSEAKGMELLDALLMQDSRQLQPHQIKYIDRQYKKSPAPLYMTLVAQEVKHWKSYDTVADVSIKGQPESSQGQEQEIQSSQQGIIAEYIQNLSNLYHHDNKLVRKILSYLLASKDGLSEAEILSIIAQDQYFINSIATDEFHQKETTELPMAIWARLSMMLRPFLSQKKQDGETLLYFFHREFEDVIKQSPGIRQEHEALVEATQKLIKENQDNPFDANRWGKLYTTLVTQYDLAYQDEIKLTEYADFIAKLTKADWIKSIQILIRDIGEYNEQENEILESLSQFKFLNNICSILYQGDNIEWVEGYVESIIELSSLCTRLNRGSNARNYLELALNICEPLYKEDSYRWAKLYTSALSLKAAELLTDTAGEDIYEYGLHELSSGIDKQVIDIIEPLYLLDTDPWKEDYVISSVNYANSICNRSDFDLNYGHYEESISIVKRAIEILKNDESMGEYVRKALYVWASNICGDIHYRVGEPDQSLPRYEESLKETEELCKINPSRWLPEYRLALQKVASLYRTNSQIEHAIEYAIELMRESTDISKELFKTNQELWADDYLSSLSLLADVYKSTSETARETTVRKKHFDVLESCYKQNPSHYEHDYLTGIDGLVSHYISIKDNSSSLKMLKYNLNITRKLYKSRAHDDFAQCYFEALEIFSNFLLNTKEISQALDLKWIQLGVYREIFERAVNVKVTYHRRFKPSLEMQDEMREDNKRTANHDYFNYLKDLGEIFFDCGKSDTAKNLLMEASDIIKDIQSNYQYPDMFDDDVTDILNKLNLVNSQESMW